MRGGASVVGGGSECRFAQRAPGITNFFLHPYSVETRLVISVTRRNSLLVDQSHNLSRHSQSKASFEV